MPIEIKWDDLDPITGARRYIRVERYARAWEFRTRTQRRGIWEKGLVPTKAMYEILLDALMRKYRRRDGVSDEQIAEVRRTLANWRGPE